MRTKGFAATSAVLSVCILACFGSRSGSAQDDAQDLLQALKDKESLELLMRTASKIPQASGYEAHFVVTTLARPFDPAQGIESNTCDFAWTRDWAVGKIAVAYNHAPVFRPLGTPGYPDAAYDSNGNLTFFRNLEKFVAFSGERNETLEVLRCYKVTPSGEAMRDYDYPHLWRWPIGDRSKLSMFEHFRLATGGGTRPSSSGNPQR